MDLKSLKNLFFSFLKQFNEKEIYLLMDYLGSLIVEYENDYSKFFQLINKESNKKNSLFENLMLPFDRYQEHDTCYDDITNQSINVPNEQETLKLYTDPDLSSDTGSLKLLDNSINSESNEITNNTSASIPIYNLEITLPINPANIKKEAIDPTQPQAKIDTETHSQVQTSILTRETQEEEQQIQAQQNNQIKTPKTRKRRTETRVLTETSTQSSLPPSSVKTSDKLCDRQLRKRLVRVSSDTDLATLKSSLAVHRPSQSHITPSKRKPTIYREYYIKHKPKTSDVELEMKVEDNFRYKFHWKIRSYLTKKYIENRYPNKAEMEEMATKTKLQFKQIMMWFKDMRRKNNHTNPTKFNSDIVNVLLKYYHINKYPTQEDIEECANESGIKQQQVIQWFQDRRYRCNHTQTRARYPKDAIEYMNKKFIQIKNPTSQEIAEMAKDIQLTKNQIYTWFKIKRKKNGINSKKK